MITVFNPKINMKKCSSTICTRFFVKVEVVLEKEVYKLDNNIN